MVVCTCSSGHCASRKVQRSIEPAGWRMGQGSNGASSFSVVSQIWQVWQVQQVPKGGATQRYREPREDPGQIYTAMASMVGHMPMLSSPSCSIRVACEIFPKNFLGLFLLGEWACAGDSMATPTPSNFIQQLERLLSVAAIMIAHSGDHHNQFSALDLSTLLLLTTVSHSLSYSTPCLQTAPRKSFWSNPAA